MLVTSILSLLLSAGLTTAARLSVSIPPSPPQLPNPATLPASTHAVLLGPPGIRYDVPIRKDNRFVFHSIEEASYLLSIHSRDHVFPPLRIDVSKSEGDATQQSITAWQTFRGNEWSNKGPQYGTGENALSIEVRPMAQKDFYMERGGFNILSFLKSPMILMSLVSVVMIFGLPKLMENSAYQTAVMKIQWTNI
jgi:ER membrane protein complex subunit 7